VLSKYDQQSCWRERQRFDTSSDKRLGQPRALFGWTPAPDIAHQDGGRRRFTNTAAPQTPFLQFTERNGDLVRNRFHDVGVDGAKTLSKTPLHLNRVAV